MFIREEKRFYRGDPNAPEAEITFKQVGPDEWSVDHTYVDSSLRGQGLAEKLLDAVAERARQEGMKLSGTCSYAKKQLATNEKYRDLAR